MAAAHALSQANSGHVWDILIGIMKLLIKKLNLQGTVIVMAPSILTSSHITVFKCPTISGAGR